MRRCARLLGLAPDAPPSGDDLELAMTLGGLTDRGGWPAGSRRAMPTGRGCGPRERCATCGPSRRRQPSSALSVTSTGGSGNWPPRSVGDRELGEAAEHLVALLGDDTPRVRVAAARALGVVGHVSPIWGRTESGSDAIFPEGGLARIFPEGGQRAKTAASSAKALNSRALPAGSRKNIVHCSPAAPRNGGTARSPRRPRRHAPARPVRGTSRRRAARRSAAPARRDRPPGWPPRPRPRRRDG